MLNPNKNLDPKSYFILNCFSEFKVKILEQAMISFYSPQINSTNSPVVFSFINVDIENFNPPGTTERVTRAYDIEQCVAEVTDTEGNLFNKYSGITIAQASESSGLTLLRIVVTYNANRKNRFIFCPKINKKLLITRAEPATR